MRSLRYGAALVLALVAQAAGAAPPKLSIPPTVPAPATGYLTLVPDTDAVSVSYVSPALDPFPSELLTDKRAFVVPVRGLDPGDYPVWAVGSSATGNQKTVQFTVVVAGKPKPPVTPPTDPPTTPVAGLYFLVVRADGPAAPSFTAAMADPAWGELVAKGHKVKDKTAAEARALGVDVPAALPCVVTLRVAADNSSSTVARAAVPLPTTSDAIRRLPEGAK